MALDEFFEPEVAVAVVVTAAVTSPPVRKVLRRGLVYGLAGLLTAGDKITAAARSVAQNVQPMLDEARNGNGVAPAASMTSSSGGIAPVASGSPQA
jgi:hypothetical protein